MGANSEVLSHRKIFSRTVKINNDVLFYRIEIFCFSSSVSSQPLLPESVASSPVDGTSVDKAAPETEELQGLCLHRRVLPLSALSAVSRLQPRWCLKDQMLKHMRLGFHYEQDSSVLNGKQTLSL